MDESEKNPFEGMIKLSQGLYINTPERERRITENALLELAKEYSSYGGESTMLSASIKRDFKRLASSLTKKAKSV